MPENARRLVIFDVDGTLVDSQEAIVASLSETLTAEGIEIPGRAEMLSIVGLSLPQAFATLVPEAPADRVERLVDGYKASYLRLREQGAGAAAAPMYPGAHATVTRLHETGYVLGVATGKARRGVDHFLHGSGLADRFSAIQTADDAPSKPHPQMVLNCLEEVGAAAADTVIVGDTEFDMAMGRAAGIRRIGVMWGYHPPERVARGGAEAMARDFEHLAQLIARIW